MDETVQHQASLLDELWTNTLDIAKEELEEEGAFVVFSTWFSTWRTKTESPDHDSRVIVYDYRMTDTWAGSILNELSEGRYLIKIKFLRETQSGIFDPIRKQKGQRAIVTINPDVLIRLDKP